MESAVQNPQAWPASQQQCGIALEFAADAILITSPEGRILYANRRAAEMLGYSPEAFAGMAFPAIVAPAGVEHGLGLLEALKRQGNLSAEIEVRRQDDTFILTDLNVSLLPDGHFYIALRDITARKRAEMSLRHKAHHDHLTGLPNRALFLDRINHQLVYAYRRCSQFAVLFIDLDNFKRINDGYGHGVGDEVLKEVARRLCSCMRQSDTVARFGGDEFYAILHDLEVSADAAGVARKIHDRVGQAIQYDAQTFQITASIGIALYPAHGTDASTLINAADRAMYLSKWGKGGNYAFAAP